MDHFLNYSLTSAFPHCSTSFNGARCSGWLPCFVTKKGLAAASALSRVLNDTYACDWWWNSGAERHVFRVQTSGLLPLFETIFIHCRSTSMCTWYTQRWRLCSSGSCVAIARSHTSIACMTTAWNRGYLISFLIFIKRGAAQHHFHIDWKDSPLMQFIILWHPALQICVVHRKTLLIQPKPSSCIKRWLLLSMFQSFVH